MDNKEMTRISKYNLLMELKHYYKVKLKDEPQSQFEVDQVFDNLLQLLDTFKS